MVKFAPLFDAVALAAGRLRLRRPISSLISFVHGVMFEVNDVTLSHEYELASYVEQAFASKEESS